MSGRQPPVPRTPMATITIGTPGVFPHPASAVSAFNLGAAARAAS